MKKINFNFLFLIGVILLIFSSCRDCQFCACNGFSVEVCNAEDVADYEEMGCDCEPY